MAKSGEIDSAERRLVELGFDPAAPPQAALATLRSLRTQEGVSVAAIARALSKIETAGAAAMLAEMESGAAGPDRREIRRALFRLAQRGIAAEAAVASPPPKPAAAEPELTAMLSPIDAEGTQIVWLIRPRHAGGLNRLWALVSESEGLVAALVKDCSRRELRWERSELESKIGGVMVDGDWRVADFILYDAYRRTPAQRRGRVGDFLVIRAELVATSPPTDFAHPVYDELRDALAVEPSSDLLKQRELAAWRLPADWIKPFVDEVAQIQNSPLLLNQAQQTERINQVVERAIAELLSDERGLRVRRHLEDVAYYLARAGRPDVAGWAASAAARIRDGADLKRIAFFQSFMRANLGAQIAEQEERAREQPRLIMTPAEAMRARQSQPRRR